MICYEPPFWWPWLRNNSGKSFKAKMSYLTWILLSVCLCVTSRIQSYFGLAEIYSTELRFSAVLLLSFWILPKFWCLDFFKNSAKLWLRNWCKSYTLGHWKLMQRIVGCSTQRWRGNPTWLVYIYIEVFLLYAFLCEVPTYPFCWNFCYNMYRKKAFLRYEFFHGFQHEICL